MTGLARTIVLVAGLTGLLASAAPVAAQGVEVVGAKQAERDKAGSIYREAKKLFDEKKYDEALKLFRDSYNVVASPNSHLMVARTLAEQGRYDEALIEYDGTLAEAKAAALKRRRYERTVRATELEQNALTAKLGFITVTVKNPVAGSQVTLNGEAFVEERLGKKTAVMAGPLKLVLTTPEGLSAERQVELSPRASIDVELVTPEKPAPAPPPPEPSAAPAPMNEPQASFDSETASGRTWAYVTGAVGVAGLAAFGAFGYLSQKKFDDLKEACPARRGCDSSLKGDADQGELFQNIANGSLVLGAAGLGASIALFFTTSPTATPVEAESAGRRSAEQAKRALRPTIDVGPGSVSVRGRF